MSQTQVRRGEQLGMPWGTASNKLKKSILFDLVRRVDEDHCFRCGGRILSVDDLSIEHKEPWLDVDVSLFWDLNNIAFSHLSCNTIDGNKNRPPVDTHGSQGYRRGCRCDICRTTETSRVMAWKRAT